MPLFISTGSYSQAGIAGLVKSPSDRADAIGKMVEAAGGKLIALYMTTGDDDFVVISEMPDGEAAVAVGMTAGASGSISSIKTVRAWTSADFTGIAQKAAKLGASYTPPGA